MITNEDSQAIAHLSTVTGDRKNGLLDFSDERQYRAALALHSLGGHTLETRPGMFAALAERRHRHRANGGVAGEQLPQSDPFETGAQVIDVSCPPGTQTPAGTGFVAIVDGAAQVNATISVFDSQQNLVAWGSGTQFNEGEYMPLYAEPQPGQTAKPPLTARIAYSFQPRGSTDWRTGAVQRDFNPGVEADPVVDHPKKHQRKVATDYIRIALGRGQNAQDDVDYWYWYSSNQTTYALPWCGSVSFTSRPKPLKWGLNPTIIGYLARSTPGSGGYQMLKVSEVRKVFDSLSVSGNKLSWYLEPPATQSPWGEGGNPLLFGDLRWPSGEADYLFMQYLVDLEGQGLAACATVASADTPDQNPLDGVTYIPRIQFLYSCLVAGTPILLADGSTIPIENVVRGSVVHCGDGVDREVSSTTIFNFGGDVLRLRTENSGEVALSGNHPVVTADGLVQAHELVPGIKVRAQGGKVSVLASVDREHYEGQLCNLRLDESAEPDPAKSTVIAGGIEVGDYALQTSHDHSYRTDPALVRAMLDPRYHPDYEHYLSEIAADR
ncbi:Hint domain-containing protein [Streptomyces sp. RP5T]|uniref:Hint domain-containing protein n=1 Tax=Streptomyces sp. RP5T TaxID=2490848 RepID=UPI000F6479B4|nr:Hint domain-containing protein [Streptomyces sp. RP5T]RRR85968.1 hypothetical protein EHS43_06005 [Streptomyces sp. RP5T]